MDEQKLIELIHADNPEAFIHVMEAYNKLLWVIVGAILHNIGSKEDIEDCISDVYLNLWQNPKAYDPEKGSLKTFLAVVAKRRALDKYRKLTRIKIELLDEAIGSTDDDLFEYVALQDLRAELYEAIRSLKEPDREILLRRYFFDEKPASIADKIQRPVKEVENRLYQSKQKLRKILKDREVLDCES